MTLSLKDRLELFLRKHGAWIASGELQRLVAQKTTYTPRTTVRRLEELAEEGVLEVKYLKGHAWYRIAQEESWEEKRLRSIEWFDGLPT